MPLKSLTFKHLKESIELAGIAGCHIVWVTDRWKYWVRDIEKHCPEEHQELISICSREDFISQGLPPNTGMVLVDKRIDVRGDFRMMFARAGLKDCPLLDPQAVLDTDLTGRLPEWWSKPIEGSEIPY